MKKIFKDYAGVNGKILEGFTVARVLTGINAKDTGVIMELERTVDNVTLGIDVVYNPDHEENETEFMISDEYVKRVD